MAQSNLEKIRELYAALQRGDGPAALGTLDPEIVWHEAENFPYADRSPYKGPAEVLNGLFARLATEWNGFTATPEAFYDAGDAILVTGRYTGTYLKTNLAIDAQFAHLWQLKDGRIIGFQQYADTAQASHVVHG
jgi:ketosteroid isomerase-like protein